MAKKLVAHRIGKSLVRDIDRLAPKYNNNKTLVVEMALERGLKSLKKDTFSKH